MYDALAELADLSLLLQDRCLSMSEANGSIDRTIRIFDSMAENHGPKFKEVNDVCAKAEPLFKNVKLSNNKAIPKIISSQFFRSLANNLRSRLFTTQASHVSSVNDNQFKENYTQLLKDLDYLDMKNWPDDCDVMYGDENIRRLAKQFQVDEVSSVRGFRMFLDSKSNSKVFDLKPLLDAINTVAISSSECERVFSSMNNIVTQKRNALSTTNLSSLLYIHCVGPPVNLFEPGRYVTSWIRKGNRSADEVCCPKRNINDEEHTYKNMWSLLNKKQ